MSKLKIKVAFFIALVANIALAKGVDEKYKNYSFEPTFGSVGEQDLGATSFLKKLEAYVGDWWGIDYKSAIKIEDVEVFAYKTRLTSEGAKNFARYQIDQEIKGLPATVKGSWEEVYAIKAGSGKSLLKDATAQGLWPQGSRVGGNIEYGCYCKNPLFKAFLFDANREDFFVVTGNGDPTDDVYDSGITRHVVMRFFRSDSLEEMLVVPLMAQNIRNTWTEGVPTPAGQFYSVVAGNSPYIEKNIDNAGRFFYAKLFFGDFDKNNKLDVLIWKRQYKSKNNVGGNKPGYEFESNGFMHYEENNSSSGFDKLVVDEIRAMDILKKNNLSWKKGWPNKSNCGDEFSTSSFDEVDSDPITKE